MNIRLHDYWRSGAAYRVRIALALKRLEFETVPHDLRLGGQNEPGYLAIAPIGLVPAIEVDSEKFVLSQSIAILEWMEERFPSPALLPTNANDRAIVRAMCGIICADTHPLNNLRVLNRLRSELGANEQQVSKWIDHWINVSFPVLESMVTQHGRGFSFGDRPTMADCCLLPQIYSARRFDVSMDPYPRLVEVERNLQKIEILTIAAPEYQTKTS